MNYFEDFFNDEKCFVCNKDMKYAKMFIGKNKDMFTLVDNNLTISVLTHYLCSYECQEVYEK